MITFQPDRLIQHLAVTGRSRFIFDESATHHNYNRLSFMKRRRPLQTKVARVWRLMANKSSVASSRLAIKSLRRFPSAGERGRPKVASAGLHVASQTKLSTLDIIKRLHFNGRQQNIEHWDFHTFSVAQSTIPLNFWNKMNYPLGIFLKSQRASVGNKKETSKIIDVLQQVSRSVGRWLYVAIRPPPRRVCLSPASRVPPKDTQSGPQIYLRCTAQ